VNGRRKLNKILSRFLLTRPQKITDYKGKNLSITLKGGLCNKLHCLVSACDIALNNEAKIIEPFFGWKKRILFSDIYDIDFFNNEMEKHNHGKQIIIPKNLVEDKKIKELTVENNIDLWDYSELKLREERERFGISRDSTTLRVLSALRLNSRYERIVDKYFKNRPYTALQVRTESDWVQYAKDKVAEKDEDVLVPLDKILMLVSEFGVDGTLFFTSGQNHEDIFDQLLKAGFEPCYFYNPDFEYEINAAINFEICCNAERFIGLSRSSYSNLISLKRAVILNLDQSYIYNLNGKILRRIDKGLQPVASLSVSKKTSIL